MGKFCHIATSRSSSRKYQKNQQKMASNIILVLTHIVLEFGMFSIAGKLSVSSISFFLFLNFYLIQEMK